MSGRFTPAAWTRISTSSGFGVRDRAGGQAQHLRAAGCWSSRCSDMVCGTRHRASSSRVIGAGWGGDGQAPCHATISRQSSKEVRPMPDPLVLSADPLPGDAPAGRPGAPAGIAARGRRGLCAARGGRICVLGSRPVLPDAPAGLDLPPGIGGHRRGHRGRVWRDGPRLGRCRSGARQRRVMSANKPTSGAERRRSGAGVLDVNLTGVFLTAQAAARRMVPAGAGVILATSSICWRDGRGQISAAYTATKGAVSNLVRSLASEWGPHGVRGERDRAGLRADRYAGDAGAAGAASIARRCMAPRDAAAAGAGRRTSRRWRASWGPPAAGVDQRCDHVGGWRVAG